MSERAKIFRERLDALFLMLDDAGRQELTEVLREIWPHIDYWQSADYIRVIIYNRIKDK